MSEGGGARTPLAGCLEVAAVVVVLVVLNQFDLTGHASLGYLLVVAAVAMSGPFVMQVGAVRRRMQAAGAVGRHLEMFRLTAACTLVVYGIGWGPVLVPGYAVLVAVAISKWQASAWRSAVVWVVAGVVIGQVAVEAGWAYSYIDTPEAHGVGVIGLLITVVMAAELGLAAERQERAERRLDALLENGSHMVTVIGPGAAITYQSRSVERVLGYAAAEVVGSAFTALVHPEELEAARAAVNEGVAHIEVRLRHSDGSWRWCAIRVTDLVADPLVAGYVLNIIDVTDRHLLEEELRHLAFHDPLTGLANRALFFDRLDFALARQGSAGGSVAVMLIDLDDFKGVNDNRGHDAGDSVLIASAELLARCVGRGEVARMGGDEFAVLLERCESEDEPASIAEAVRSAFAVGGVTGDGPGCTVSVGVALSRVGGSGAKELLGAADEAMYEAKARGKDRAVMARPDSSLGSPGVGLPG